jgi:O-acetyl-ADP-ribose deacetylase (regulator of RNase III)
MTPELEIVEGDITALAVDAIANAANDHLWMGAGVAGAIKRAGGEEIEREAIAQAAAAAARRRDLPGGAAQSSAPIEVGDAVATGAGRLQARWVIHAAVMGQDLATSADAIRRATRSTLEVADGLGAESLALPVFGTGVGGFSLEECARIMVAEARRFDAQSLRRIVFAVYGPDAELAFRNAL